MTTFLLIRHAAHDLLGRVLAGRAPDVHLNARGKMEAERLAGRLAQLPVAALYMGPLERAQETAWPIAEGLRIHPRIEPAFDEIDFGAWTSHTFAELEHDPEWRRWNTARSEGQPPGGERMATVQSRFVAALERLRDAHRDAIVAVVSHGDAIKAALMHYLGVPLDSIARLEVSPASVSRLTIGEGFHQVVSINDTCAAP